jgi:hypothetical protein
MTALLTIRVEIIAQAKKQVNGYRIEVGQIRKLSAARRSLNFNFERKSSAPSFGHRAFGYANAIVSRFG